MMNRIATIGIFLLLCGVTSSQYVNCYGKNAICTGPLSYKPCIDDGFGVMIVDNSRKLQLCPPGSRCRNNGSSICQRLRTIPPPTTSTTTTTTAASTSTEGVNKPTEPSIISTEFVLSSTVPTVDDLSTISTSSTTSYSTISENDIPTNSTVSISENIPSSSTTEFIFKTSESSTISSTKNLESTTTNSSTVGYGIESVDASTDMNSTVSISESTPSESFSTTGY
uniref:Chitin-binding type-2 domain-containing protein n=1 Tax=Megaselia scalaris TaxID=36166 RepID=T1H1N6_MEGSC